MDAVKFIKEINRLCEAQEDCEDCPLIGHACDVNKATIMSCYNIESVQKMVQIVEQWAKDHPVKTRQSEFLKLFPNAQKSDGIINICPILIDEDCKSTSECRGTRCNVCRQLCWNEEVTDND